MIVRDWQQSRWVDRGIFLAVTAAMGLTIFYLIVLPIQAVFLERDASIAAQRDLLARLAAVAAQEPSVMAAIRKAADEAKLGEFLGGANDGVISAELQARLKAIVEQSGARLRSVQALPASTTDVVRYVGSRVEMIGTHRTLHRAIHTIENGSPYLFVTSASIRSAASTSGPPARDEPILEARLDVFGAVQIKAPGQ
jgi:hypothetical protein